MMVGQICRVSDLSRSFRAHAPLGALFAIIGDWFYAYHDSGHRGMNQWLWTAIAIFTPNLLGIPIYLIMREGVLNRAISGH